MSSEIARREDADSFSSYTRDQVDLIKRTFAKGTSDDEFALFMETANRTGLSPLAKQIHPVKRWSKRERREVMTIQTGIDGYRLIADRTGRRDGEDGPYWCDDAGRWHDVWLSKSKPRAARFVVYKQGSQRGYTGIAHWDEYAQTDKDGNLTRFWSDMPAGQLAKCAEALALRKAFPQELSGLYTVDEMAQADQDTGPQGEPARVRGRPSTADPAVPVHTSGPDGRRGRGPGPDHTPDGGLGPPGPPSGPSPDAPAASGGQQAPQQVPSTPAAEAAAVGLIDRMDTVRKGEAADWLALHSGDEELAKWFEMAANTSARRGRLRSLPPELKAKAETLLVEHLSGQFDEEIGGAA